MTDTEKTELVNVIVETLVTIHPGEPDASRAWDAFDSLNVRREHIGVVLAHAARKERETAEDGAKLQPLRITITWPNPDDDTEDGDAAAVEDRLDANW
jgi:hypothetical protein